MPIRKPQKHTIKSVELVASRLDALASSIRVSSGIMAEQPPMNELEIEWQNALEIGISRLQTWADALRDAVDEKRMELAVSDSPKAAKKPKAKTL